MKFETTIICEKNEIIEKFLYDHGTVFHSYVFLNTVGTDYRVIIVYDSFTNTIAGVLPLVKTKKYGLKTYYIPPFCYQFGPIISNLYVKEKTIILELLIGSIEQSKNIDFSIMLEEQDILVYLKYGYLVTAFQTHKFYYTGKPIIEMFAKNKQSDIKKLLNSLNSKYIYLTQNEDVNWDDIKKLTITTAKRTHFNPHIDILDSIFSSNIQKYSNVIYKSDGTPLAACVCPFDKHTMYHLIGVSARIDDKLLKQVNFLSLYLAIVRAVELGLQFDFEGSSIPGIANFYRLMGGVPVLNYRIQKTRSIYYHFLRFLKAVKTERK